MTADIRIRSFLKHKVVGSNPVTIIVLHLTELGFAMGKPKKLNTKT